MERLWSPWRYDYMKSGANDSTQSVSCVFCDLALHPADDEKNFVVLRAGHNLVVLNIYPYISGHLLVVPYLHIPELDEAAKEITDELMDLTKKCQAALRCVYRPHGFNVGMNLGKSAGAGIAGHLHLHIMPRWTGDVNFMSTIAETRVIPESLETTYQKLRGQI